MCELTIFIHLFKVCIKGWKGGIINMEEVINLNCNADESTSFEKAIKQLGYEIIDCSWNDENNTMFYKVKKSITINLRSVDNDKSYN